MTNNIKSGDLALYCRSEHKVYPTYCIVISHINTDYEYYYKGSQPVNYFSCLIEGRIETICDIWLKK